MQRELARRHVEACLDPPRGRVVTGHARARRVLPVEMADDVAAPAERPGLVREVEERLELWQSRGLAVADRSEEHTSELQSPCNLVCRLLLEKKNRQNSVWPRPR